MLVATKRLMVAWRSITHRKTPRFSRCLASLAKNPSIALSHEHEVGVKWKAKRGCLEPLTHLWMLADGVVVEDHVHRLFGRQHRQLVDELRVVGELELPDPVRLQTIPAPDALDGTCADADCFRHHVAVQWVASAGGSVWVSMHNTLGDIRPKGRDARRSRLIAQQAVVTGLHEAFLPAPHTGFRLAVLAHDLIGADAVGAQQNDLGPPDMLMRCVAIPTGGGDQRA